MQKDTSAWLLESDDILAGVTGERAQTAPKTSAAAAASKSKKTEFLKNQ